MRPFFLPLLMLLFIRGFLPIPPEDPDRFKLHLRKGDESYRACDNANALREYERAYQLAPDSLSTLLRMVRTYNDMGRLKLDIDSSSQTYYREAEKYADIIIRLYPNRPESHFWLALGRGSLIPFLGVGDKIRIGKEEQEEAQKAIELDSTFSHAYVILAIFQREGAQLGWFEKTFVRIVFGRPILGSLEESQRLLQEALRFDGRNPYALYEMYWTCAAMGKIDKAKCALQSLIAIQPANAREQQQRGEALRILSNLERLRSE